MSAVTGRRAPPATARQKRDAEVGALQALARRLRTSADLVDVAATYWADGAFDTARARLKSAISNTLGVVRAVNLNRWHVP